MGLASKEDIKYRLASTYVASPSKAQAVYVCLSALGFTGPKPPVLWDVASIYVRSLSSGMDQVG
jgi:hypothetical protein